MESDKAEVLGAQAVRSGKSVFSNIWGARAKNRLLAPSPRDSDTDLEMDSDMDPLFLPNHTHPVSQNHIVRGRGTIAVRIGRGDVDLKGHIRGNRAMR